MPGRPAWLSAALILAVASLPLPAQAWGCIAELDVYDRAANQTLPVYRRFGKRWVAGEPGHEYALRVRNCTDARVLAVVSVDGVNVITGQSASPSQSGYVLEPGEVLTIEGWRKSMERTAAFVFTDPADSYAARTGRPHDLGVIGAALFREARPPAVAQEVGPPYPAVPAPRQEGAAGPESKSRDDSAESQRAASLGTGHGRSEHSPAQWTRFERASASPDETISVRYETEASLAALGVVPRERVHDRDPDPFPQLGFVPDP